MRAFLVYPTMVVMTLVLATPILVLVLLGKRVPRDSVLGRAGYHWSRAALWAAGVKVVVRNPEHIGHGEARVYVCNHVSWFEIFALATVLPHFRFMAKKEIASVPLFGPAAGEVAAIYIDRGNRRAAFGSYRGATTEMRSGVSIGVFPEGTRGRSYELRPFKKGPFVLAIDAQAPVVPVVSWGSREVQRKGELAVHSGTIELTFLEPIPTAGMGYEDRDELMRAVWHRMAAVLETKGVHSGGAEIAASAV